MQDQINTNIPDEEESSAIEGTTAPHSTHKNLFLSLGVLLVLILVVSVFAFFNFERGMDPGNQIQDNDSSQRSETQDNGNSDKIENVYQHEISKFFEKDGKIYLQDTKNVSLRTPLLFDQAKPASFKQIERFVGFDNTHLHFAEYDRGQETYIAISIPLTNTELEMLRLLDPNTPVTIKWTLPNNLDSEALAFGEVSESIRRAIGRSLVTVNTVAGEVAHVMVEGMNPKLSVHSTGKSLLIFTRDGIYQAAPNAPTKEILDLPWYKTAYRSGDETIYYTESFSDLSVLSYNTESEETREVYVSGDQGITNSTRIYLSPDNEFLVTKISKEASGRGGGAITLIQIDTGKITTVAESNLLPIALSPDNSRVFAISVPYEGYLFSKLKYFISNTDGTWQQEPTEMNTVRIEVGGGWNINTQQWIASPQGNYLAFADETSSSVPSCGGFGGTPVSHNTLKVLNLKTLQVLTLETGAPLEDYVIDHWLFNENGFYFRKDTLALSEDQNWKCADTISERGAIRFVSLPK